MKKNYSILICLLFVFESITNAQISNFAQRDTSENGTISFGKLNVSVNPVKQNQSIKFLKSVLNMQKEDSLRRIRVTKDDRGYEHDLYQQYFKGFRVENTLYAVHSNINGNIVTINGNFKKIYSLNTEINLKEDEALNNALFYINAKK